MLRSCYDPAIDGAAMIPTTVSCKYQIISPREVRHALNLRRGQTLQVIFYDNRIELIPLQKPRALRGLLTGIEREVQPGEDGE